MAWSARCDCRNNHNSASGRCNARNITDPTRTQADNFAACEDCRANCPCGNGPEELAAPVACSRCGCSLPHPNHPPRRCTLAEWRAAAAAAPAAEEPEFSSAAEREESERLDKTPLEPLDAEEAAAFDALFTPRA
jgi:hypothetical protein